MPDEENTMSEEEQFFRDHVKVEKITVYDGSEDDALHITGIEGYSYLLQTLDHPQGTYMFTVWVKPVNDMSLAISSLGCQKTFDLTALDGWRKLEIFTEEPSDDYIELVAMKKSDNLDDDLYLYKGMLELSNHATDWRPAPEDDEEQIQDLYRTVEVTKSEIFERTTEQIELGIQEVTKTFEDGILASEVKLQSSINLVKDNIEQAVERVQYIDGEYTKMETWQRFDENGIHMGKKENGQLKPFSMDLNETQLTFNYNQKPMSYFSNEQLYIEKAQINNTLRFGDYAFMPTSTGMALVYVGSGG